MRRREFISLLGGAAAAWPLAARTQQALPVVGFLHEGFPAPPSLTAAFQEGLIETGIRNARNVTIENRWAEGQYDRLPGLTADLITHRVGLWVDRAENINGNYAISDKPLSEQEWVEKYVKY